MSFDKLIVGLVILYALLAIVFSTTLEGGSFNRFKDVLVVVTPIFNMGIVVWIFFKSKADKEVEKNRENAIRSNSFWSEKVVVTPGINNIQSLVDDSESILEDHSKFASSNAASSDEFETARLISSEEKAISSFKRVKRKFRHSYLFPLEAVDSTLASGISSKIEELEDFVVGCIEQISCGDKVDNIDSQLNNLKKDIFILIVKFQGSIK